MTLIVHTDGASRGNPGPAAAAFIITAPSGKLIAQSGKFLGHTTNNQAEYHAVLLALNWTARNIKKIFFNPRRSEGDIFEAIEEEPSKTLFSNLPGGDDELSEDSQPSVPKKYLRGSPDTARLPTINFYLDSELVVRQLSGRYKIKSKELLPLAIEIKSLQNSLNSQNIQIFFHSVPRRLNQSADRLVNQVLDSQSA